MNTEKTPTQPQEVKTLRDEFALAALTGLLSDYKTLQQYTADYGKDFMISAITDAYEAADEMLKAREK